MAELTSDTGRLIERLFRPEERAAVRDLLEHECGDNLPLTGPSRGPAAHDRIRFAALKVSGGDLEKLRDTVRHATVDWRDVLVWAGFGHSLTAHQQWARRVLSKPRDL